MVVQFCFLFPFPMTCQLLFILNQFCLPLELPRIFAMMGNRKCYFCSQSYEMVQEKTMRTYIPEKMVHMFNDCNPEIRLHEQTLL
jgi:hypothetical protein